jgi:hypothetical protein
VSAKEDYQKGEVCEICGGGHAADKILLCDGCDRGEREPSCGLTSRLSHILPRPAPRARPYQRGVVLHSLSPESG